MKQKKIVSLVTAAGFWLNASGSSMAFDFFGDEVIQRNREQLAFQTAEIQRQRAEIEALKRMPPTEAFQSDQEPYRHPRQFAETDRSDSEEQYQEDRPSLSWGQIALLGLGALVLLNTFSGSSGSESAYTDSGGSSGGSSSGGWFDEGDDDPWDDVPVDTSIGCSWGDRAFGTCH